MGDADASLREASADYQIEQVSDALDALDEDLSQLNDTVQDLERRMLRAISIQIRGYKDFRRFFLAMNFIILPLIIAVGLCYSLKGMVENEGTQSLLHTTILLLLYVTGSLGVPLYLGALWAIYKFSVTEEPLNDALRTLLTTDNELFDTLPVGRVNESNESGVSINEPQSAGVDWILSPSSDEAFDEESASSSDSLASQGTEEDLHKVNEGEEVDMLFPEVDAGLESGKAAIEAM